MDYFYIQNEEKQGPVSEQEIIKLFREGVITEETHITRSGKTTWLPLKSILIRTRKKPRTYSTLTTPMGLSIWECFCRCFKLYCRFDGRGTRKEFWSFQLGHFCISQILGFIFVLPASELFGLWNNGEIDPSMNPWAFGIIVTFCVLFSFAFLIPGLSCLWRRLHDTGLSGWITLIYLIPGIGLLIILGLCLVDSNEGDNKYGPSEKYPNKE